MKYNYCFYSLFVYFLFFTIKCEKPNIIVIIADDFGWGDVGLHGSEQVKTPNIDVLASNGVILNNYYVSPICSPSRGALMSGRHPIHTGLQHNVFHASKPEGLPLKYKILPQYLKDLGYETHAVGKWHQGFFQRQYIPSERGFDSHFGYWAGKGDYFDRTCEEDWWGIDFHSNEQNVNISEYEGLYSTQIYTNKSVDIILNRKENSSKPLFLYLAHQSVHSGNMRHPLQSPQQYIDRFNHIKDINRRTFVAMVSVLDDSIGQIFSALQRAQILNNTIIIFTTDNGAAVGSGDGVGIDGSIGSNWPLRGAKFTLFEGGIRGISFIWSSLLKNQYVSNNLMHIQDWLPTIYSAVGGQLKDLGDIDGIDMWDAIKNKLNVPRKQLLHNIDDIWKVWALRDGDYKLISGSTLNGKYDKWFLPPGESTRTLITQFDQNYYKKSKVYEVLKQMNFSYKSVEPLLLNCSSTVKTECEPTKNPCLFDIKSDPCEYHNLFDRKPEIVKTLLKQLSEYNSTAVKPIITIVDPKSNPALHNNRWQIYE